MQTTIVDTTTRNPVAGAEVYVFGESTVTPTASDSNGNVSFDDTGVTMVCVQADGYQVYQGPPASTIELVPQSQQLSGINFQVEPTSQDDAEDSGALTAGAAIVLSDSHGNVLENLTVGDDGTAFTVNQYPAGTTYSVSVSKSGFQTLQTTFTSSSQTTVLTLISDGTQQPAPDQQPTASTTSSNTLPPVPSTAPPDGYEFIYPNSEDGKYFQASQSRMYIGNLFIDELNLCQFQLMDNKIPVYGFRSRFFDAVGIGHSLVQGQIAINFVSEGYLYTVLQEFDRLQNAQDMVSDLDPSVVSQVQQLTAMRAKTNDKEQLAEIDDALVTLAGGSPDYLALIKSSLATANGQKSQLTSYNTIHYQNACYLDIPFNIEVDFEGAGRTVKRKLQTCFLGANDLAIAHDGKTLLDTYGFIARSFN